ncbi:MAG TPA: hypothetical protein VF148_02950 [Acidimicrobiia bacterium]
MVGKGRHPILGVWSPDPVLSTVAPIGLAAAAGTALVVDLVTTTPVPGRTLADLVADGPRLAELSPGRPGIALLPGGNVDRSVGLDMLLQLAGHWPAVVVRAPDTQLPFAAVPVVPLFPGRLAPTTRLSHAVWQPVGAGAEPPGPGPVLPSLRAGVVRRLLSGHLPRRSRWIAAWRPIWEMPWA